MRTKSHPKYSPPTKEEVKAYLESIKLNMPVSVKSVVDLTNAASFYFENENVSSCFTEKTSESVKSMLQSIDFDLYQGETPLQKAISFLRAIYNVEGIITNDSNSTKEEDELTVFSKEVQRKNSIKELQEELVHLRNQPAAVKEFVTEKLYYLQRAGIPIPKFLEKLALVKSFSKIKASATTPTPQSMQEYSQIASLYNVSNIALPNFAVKFAKKDLLVKNYEETKKQSLFFLVDDSGSMNENKKVLYVNALLCDRIQAVLENKAILYIATFESCIDRVYAVTNSQEAREILKKNILSFNGCNTNIEHSVKQCIKAINEGRMYDLEIKKVHNPQIVVINDGEDFVDKNFKPEIPTNGFILGGDNVGMKAMCENSKGVYHRFF
ncbi:MAG: hypothetical protein QXW79_02390 [Thermoplasmata archaeon]